MERLTNTVLQHAQRQPEGEPVLAKGLLRLGNRAAVDQALSRLVRRGALLRAGRGVYVLPVESRFGRRAPSVENTVQRVAAALGERIANSGAMAANALGLTTQVPVKRVFLTSGSNRVLTLGRERVELRHAPAWQLVLPVPRAGDAVRALAWLGRDKAGAAAADVRRRLSEYERRELGSVSAQMPGWLAGAAKALADRDIAASVAAHKAAFFREKGASENGVDYSVAVAGGMRLTRRRGAVGVGGRLCADGAERVAAPPPPGTFRRVDGCLPGDRGQGQQPGLTNALARRSNAACATSGIGPALTHAGSSASLRSD